MKCISVTSSFLERDALAEGGLTMYYYYLNQNDHNSIIRINEEGITSRLDLPGDEWVPVSAVDTSKLLPLDTSDVQMIQKAFETAREAHRNQKDKAGKDYILHPLTVAQLCAGNAGAITAALLHDVVEDTEVTLNDLREKGFPERVITAVDALTRRKEEPRDVYLKRVKQNAVAVQVKLADLIHNSDLSRFSSPSEKDIARAETYRSEMAFLEEKK